MEILFCHRLWTRSGCPKPRPSFLHYSIPRGETTRQATTLHLNFRSGCTPQQHQISKRTTQPHSTQDVQMDGLYGQAHHHGGHRYTSAELYRCVLTSLLQPRGPVGSLSGSSPLFRAAVHQSRHSPYLPFVHGHHGEAKVMNTAINGDGFGVGWYAPPPPPSLSTVR